MKPSRSTKLYLTYSTYMYTSTNETILVLRYSTIQTSTYSMIWHISIDETIPSPFLSFPTRRLIEILSEIKNILTQVKSPTGKSVKSLMQSEHFAFHTVEMCDICVEEKTIDNIIPEYYLLESNCFTFVFICAMFSTSVLHCVL